jgi:hypothetical protein
MRIGTALSTLAEEGTRRIGTALSTLAEEGTRRIGTALSTLAEKARWMELAWEPKPLLAAVG